MNPASYVVIAYVIGLGLLVGYAAVLMFACCRNSKGLEVNHGDSTRRA